MSGIYVQSSRMYINAAFFLKIPSPVFDGNYLTIPVHMAVITLLIFTISLPSHSQFLFYYDFCENVTPWLPQVKTI
jgi:hypothetical protein